MIRRERLIPFLDRPAECAFCANATRVGVKDDSRPWARDLFRCGLTGHGVEHDDTCDQFSPKNLAKPLPSGKEKP